MAAEAAIFDSNGDTLQVTVSGSAVVAGDINVISDKVVIAKDDAAIGALLEYSTNGAFRNVPNLTTDVVAIGDQLYWNEANSETQKAVTATFFGYALSAAGNGVTRLKAYLANTVL